MTKRLAILLSFLLVSSVHAVWLDSDWTHRRLVTIQSDATGFTEDLVNYPAYVPIEADADIGVDCMANGYDLRFTLSDGTTLLSYERPVWSVTKGSATGYCFVKVNAESDDSSPAQIWLYWGHADATDGQDITGTWDANYMGVWHLDETTGLHLDSTSNNNDSNVVSVTTEGTTASTPLIGGYDVFDGTNDYIRIPYDSTLDGWTGMTLEAWVWKDSTAGDGYQRIFDHGTSTFGYLLYMGGSAGSSGVVGFKLCAAGVGGNTVDFTSILTAATEEWEYLAITWYPNSSGGDDAIRPYLNGVLGAIQSRNGDTVGVTTDDLYIGDNVAGTRSFAHRQDELRISNIARSASYFALVNAQFTSVDHEITLGAKENYGGAPPSAGTAIGKVMRLISRYRRY